ncbi:MAG: hypothetical protein GXO47_08685 [Chlorobi bacterium]|nr:hypothetical protein [Chlorobiota bacterium]
MKKIADIRVFLMLLILFLTPALTAQKTVSTNGLSVTFDKKLKIVSLKGDKEYLPPDTESYLLRVKSGESVLSPKSARWKGNEVRILFEKGIEVTMAVGSKGDYMTFTVQEVKNESLVDVLFYGPFPVSISETIGEVVGVVRNGDYAIGIQSLNAKTTGGKLVNPDGSDPSRGTTASKEEYGSALQAYCINRNKDRVYNIWNNSIPDAYVPANRDGALKGSAIALFGTTEDKVLDVIEKIELGEGIPHPTLNDVWVKKSPDANKPYLITTFTEENIDEIIEYTKKLGYNTIYHAHPFKNWGHFELIDRQFPHGYSGMKKCVDKATAEGIRVGVHTLTNFITTNDPFVTPVPDEGLMKFAVTKLAKPLSETDKDIFIEDPKDYDYKNTNQTIMIGEELIKFRGVTKEAPYKLLNVKRGAYNTKASAHKEGEKVARLVDHAYKVFFPDFQMQKDMILYLSNFFNETGVGQMDFDGHEGGYGTGEGDFGMDYFSEEFLKEVEHEVRNGSSRLKHYYWHNNSYINWGEPWYGGFTKSQGHARYKNQAFLKRNYTPNMLGWFLLTSHTTLQEFEFMLARSAGYDAGYALFSNLKDMQHNPEFDDIALAVRTWEEARLKKIFTPGQREELKNVNNEFSLRKKDDKTFELQYYNKRKFELENIMVQPGQPNDVTVDFDSKGGEPLYFVIGAVGEEGTIDEITIEFNSVGTIIVDKVLKPNWQITYRGGNEVLVYDDKGRFKTKVKLDIDGLILSEGTNTLRISAQFSDGADVVLSGYVRTKGKSEIIKL